MRAELEVQGRVGGFRHAESEWLELRDEVAPYTRALDGSDGVICERQL